MGRKHWTKPEAVLEQQALALKAQPTELRRCLKCDCWMHSAGADHRICNFCKHEPPANGSRVGRRVCVKRAEA